MKGTTFTAPADHLVIFNGKLEAMMASFELATAIQDEIDRLKQVRSIGPLSSEFDSSRPNQVVFTDIKGRSFRVTVEAI